MNAFQIRLLCAAVPLIVGSSAFAQNVLSQKFESLAAPGQIASTGPSGWSVQTFYADGSSDAVQLTQGTAEWLGWKFLDKSTWLAKKTANASTKRGDFALGLNGMAVIESDGLRAQKVYSSSLIAPAVNVSAGKSYVLHFNAHYRQGQSPQTADVLVTFDKGPAVSFAVTADALNQAFEKTFAIPAGATTAQLSWNYRSTSNNWYWALDDVSLDQDQSVPPPPFDPSALPKTDQKPALSIGPTLQNPGPDHMAVMLETTEKAPTVWVRKAGSSTPFTIVQAANAVGDFSDASIFFADVKTLESNTLYEYAVVTGTSAAPKVAGPYQFKTWPRESDGVKSAKFAVVSDTQDVKDDRLKNIVQGVIKNDCEAAAAKCAQTLAGFMVPGDLVGSGGTRSSWVADFFGPLQALSAYVPLIPAPGNHEYFLEQASAGVEKSWAKTYRKYFNRMPANGSTKHPLHWYSLDYLGLRIVGSDFTPASAMHNTGNWNNYDSGRGLFRADYMKEQLDWFTALMSQTQQDKKPYVVLLNHHPCLSEKWRQGEVMAACDFIAQLEDYGRSSGAITANLNGHVHYYERGNSMDSRHLWLNVASGSGALEGAKQDDDSDLDVIVNSKLSFGYGSLQVAFGDKPSLEWKRYDLGGSAVSATADDAIRITSEAFAAKPKLPQAALGKVDPAKVQLRYAVDPKIAAYEAQWQVSKDPKFGTAQPVFDVWGNETRRRNWSYINGQRVDTQKNADIATLDLGRMLLSPKRVYPNVAATTKRGKVVGAITPGANSLLDRWSCAYKWDELDDPADARQGGRQCFARLVQEDGEQAGAKGSAFDPFHGKPPTTLSFGSDERWFWRVRVRDEQLNWSEWSDAGSFELGAPVPAIAIESHLPPSASGRLAVDLQVSTASACASAEHGSRAPDAASIPKGWTALTDEIAFVLRGCPTGETAQVSLGMSGAVPEKARLVKVTRPNGGPAQLADIPGASFAAGSIRYGVEDGGPLDEDGVRNGEVVDPVLVLVPEDATVPPVIPPVTPPVTPPGQVAPVPVDHPGLLALMGLVLALFGFTRIRKQRARG